MSETLFLFYFGILIAISLLVALYLRIVRRTVKTYKKAASFIDDIIFSFNKDIETAKNQITQIGSNVEKSSEEIVKTKKTFLARVDLADFSIGQLSESHKNLGEDISRLKENLTQFSVRNDEFDNRLTKLELRDMITGSHEIVDTPIKLEKQKVMGPLTDTERVILNMLDLHGEKSAPEIQQQLNLSREHTSRLMKSMYSRGYIERRTNKMPYKYFLKKELKDLMQSNK